MKSKKRFRFREFQIYKDSRFFILKVKKYSRDNFPKDERFSLTSQLWRALDSILLNIAEGSDRGTDKDFAHFLNNSHTSTNEVVACLDLALDNEYIDMNKHEEFLDDAEKLVEQLTAFRMKLLNDANVKGQVLNVKS